MKKLVLFGLLAFSMTTLTSCLKEYTCNCPGGTKATVKTVSKSEGKKSCEEETNGICTL